MAWDSVPSANSCMYGVYGVEIGRETVALKCRSPNLTALCNRPLKGRAFMCPAAGGAPYKELPRRTMSPERCADVKAYGTTQAFYTQDYLYGQVATLLPL